MIHVKDLTTHTSEQLSFIEMVCVDVLNCGEDNWRAKDGILVSRNVSMVLLHMLEDMHLVGSPTDFFTAVEPPAHKRINLSSFRVTRATSKWVLYRTWDWLKEYDNIVQDTNSNIMRRFYRMFEERKRLACMARLKAIKKYGAFDNIELSMIITEFLVPQEHALLHKIGWYDKPSDEDIREYQERNFISTAPKYKIYESSKSTSKT